MELIVTVTGHTERQYIHLLDYLEKEEFLFEEIKTKQVVQPIPAEQEKKEGCSFTGICDFERECEFCDYYSIPFEQPDISLEEQASKWMQANHNYITVAPHLLDYLTGFAKSPSVAAYHTKGMFTKEQVLKAAELGEVNHFDAEHIVSLLDEVKR